MGIKRRKERNYSLLISPGTGKVKVPMVHSPFVPGFPPIGGLPPTSTTLNTSTSSCTSPDRALDMVNERAFSSCFSRDVV